MTDKEDTTVKATATSVRLIEVLLEHNGATITELDDQVAFSKSTIHNHLDTLKQLGFVIRDNWTYRVSLRFLQIGGITRNRHPLYRASATEVRQLSTASRLVASLVVVERKTGICLCTAAREKADEPLIEMGDTLPLHCTAPGKALLAAMSPADVDAIIDQNGLSKYTGNTLTSRSDLDKELQDIRSRGIAFDREEWQEDVRGIAAVIDDSQSQLGAISVVSSADTMSGKRFQQDIPGLVISSANRIQKKIRSQ